MSLSSKRYVVGLLVVLLLIIGLVLLLDLVVLLFEYGCALGMSLVSNSIHPCKLVGLLPFMYVYIGLSFLCVTGEWYFVK